MRTAVGVDRLRGDAHPTAALTHRAFEHVADAEFTRDLLHIDSPTFAGKARIARDEPADPAERCDDSSIMPSTKYSCFGSPLRLAEGSTAIDGLSGNARSKVERFAQKKGGRSRPKST